MGRSKHDWELARARLIEGGETLREVSEDLGIPLTTLHRRLKEWRAEAEAMGRTFEGDDGPEPDAEDTSADPEPDADVVEIEDDADAGPDDGAFDQEGEDRAAAVASMAWAEFLGDENDGDEGSIEW